MGFLCVLMITRLSITAGGEKKINECKSFFLKVDRLVRDFMVYIQAHAYAQAADAYHDTDTCMSHHL